MDKKYISADELHLIQQKNNACDSNPFRLVQVVKEWTGAKEAGHDSKGVYYKT